MASWLVCSTPDRAVRGSSPGRGHCVVFLGITLTVPLFTQVYKWVLENLMLGVTLRWTSIPSRGRRNTPSHFMLQKLELSTGLMSHLGSNADFTFTKIDNNCPLFSQQQRPLMHYQPLQVSHSRLCRQSQLVYTARMIGLTTARRVPQ